MDSLWTKCAAKLTFKTTSVICCQSRSQPSDSRLSVNLYQYTHLFIVCWEGDIFNISFQNDNEWWIILTFSIQIPELQHTEGLLLSAHQLYVIVLIQFKQCRKQKTSNLKTSIQRNFVGIHTYRCKTPNSHSVKYCEARIELIRTLCREIKKN